MTISSRLAAIWGELRRHGALNDMAAVLLDASLVVLLGVVTVSDLRTRLIPDARSCRPSAGGGSGLRSRSGQLPERLRGGRGPAASCWRRPDPPDGMASATSSWRDVLGLSRRRVIEAMMSAFAVGSRRGWC
jgi:hypothetical protein